MKIPDEGGIATGGHTIKVSSNSYAGYNVLLSASEANNDETSLVNTTNGSSSIPTTIGNLTTPSKLDNNAWGYALTNPAGQETNAIWAGLQPSTHKTAIATTNSLSNQTDNYSVYYGVRVDNPEQLLAGDYQTQVVYTATVNPVEPPAISAIDPSQIETPTNGRSLAIGGSNLASTYNITLHDQNNNPYSCTNIAITDDTKVSCALPNLPVGKYDLVLTTQGGQIGDGVEVVEPHEPVFGDIAYMQDMTPALCASAPEGDTTQLVDKRDGKKYWVAKLADGNCWMTQNLDLDLSKDNTLTPNNTNISKSWTPSVSTTTTISGYDNSDTGKSYDAGNQSYDGVYDVGNAVTAHYLAGNYYQWTAAAAGNANFYGDSAQSICSRGWKLPSESQFSALVSSGLTSSSFMNAPYYLLRSGELIGDSLNGAGYSGSYWSSNPLGTSAYYFSLSVRDGAEVGNSDRSFGRTVRCIVDN